MPDATGLATATVSIRGEVETLLEERIPSLESSQEELVAEAEAEYDTFANTPPEYEQTYDKLEEQKVEARGRANALARFIAEVVYGIDTDKHGVTEAEAILELEPLPDDAEAEFVISELTGGQLALVEDDVAEESFEVDMESEEVSGTPRSGYGRVLTCKHGIEEWPDECPTDKQGRCAVDEFSHRVQDYLYDRINNLNTVGDTDLGNSSLRAAMDSSS